MFSYRLLKENMGSFKAVLALMITVLFWFVCTMRLIDDHKLDMLMGATVGVSAVVIIMPIIRRHLLVYHVLISFVAFFILGIIFCMKTFPIAQQDEIGWIILLIASFYLHSALWVYGCYSMPRTLSEFREQWGQRHTQDVGEVEPENSESIFQDK